MRIQNVAIIGMGALGLLYGDHIARHIGNENVCYVMDPERVSKYEHTDFTINNRKVAFPIRSCEDKFEADLVILAVKYTGIESALKVMESCVGPDTIIISVMNGISSEEMISERFGKEKVLYAVAQGMDAMRFGNALRFTQMGKIHYGIGPGGTEENFRDLKAFFEKIEMPSVPEEDILWRLWFKFMLNVGVNQTCMVYDTTYDGVLNPGEPNRMLVAAMREVEMIANAKGIHLTEKDLNTCIAIERTLDPNGTPSMGQDRINRKKSEVDMFAGTVIRLGKELDILVPANQYLYDRVQEIEKDY